MGEAASLLWDRNFVKGPDHCPRAISIQGFGLLICACIYEWCRNRVPLGSAVPLIGLNDALGMQVFEHVIRRVSILPILPEHPEGESIDPWLL
jgi:hypothetical protein